jgi:hypothetical protein
MPLQTLSKKHSFSANKDSKTPPRTIRGKAMVGGGGGGGGEEDRSGGDPPSLTAALDAFMHY